ncbi:MAG: UbiA family prenyltransferase [Synergistetes bacterium]|nr:UbiA family prenyltransferase [Synergistota bacterium]
MIKMLIDVYRPKRWYRNTFMLVGALFALKVLHQNILSNLYGIIVGFISICLVASGNYGINEILDAEADAHHPEKRHRAIPSGRISKRFVLVISVLLYLSGLVLSTLTNNYMLEISVLLLLISGILYNVKPFRLKDKPYLDFISEAANNPIRLLVGWYSVASAEHLVPASVVLGFWFLGIFLMASKRFAEIRFVRDRNELVAYRKSFAHYSEEKLMIAIVASLAACSFMFGAISMKYSADLILLLPFVVVFVVWFFHLLYEENSIVKDPERIFEKKWFLVYSTFVLLLFVYFLFTGNQYLGFLRRIP